MGIIIVRFVPSVGALVLLLLVFLLGQQGSTFVNGFHTATTTASTVRFQKQRITTAFALQLSSCNDNNDHFASSLMKRNQQQQQQQQHQQKMTPRIHSPIGDDEESTNSIQYWSSSSCSSRKTSNRRDALSRVAMAAGGFALSSFLLGKNLVHAATSGDEVVDFAADAASLPSQTILLMGANSGIGFDAAKRLATQEGIRLILPCRTYAKSVATVQAIVDQYGLPEDRFLAAECDLANLASIEQFVSSLQNNHKDFVQSLNVVCLNAGISRNTEAKDVARTRDGFELTVGTNHLGHFYLNHLLLPFLLASSASPPARIVVTASGVHDPASPGGAQGVPATLGNLLGLERDGKFFSMVDGGEFNADKAYKDSKLCNVLFTRELQRRLDASDSTRGRVTANCFNPGLIVSTGLFRDQNPVFTKLFDFAATDLFKVGESVEWGGGCLSYMTTVDSKGQYYTSPPGTSSKVGTSAAYGREFTVSQVSQEAQDNAKAKRLWELSEQLVGVTTKTI